MTDWDGEIAALAVRSEPRPLESSNPPSSHRIPLLAIPAHFGVTMQA